MNSLGIYIHIPFCKKKCNYCDFCSFADITGNILERYTEELCRRIEGFAVSRQEKACVSTVYFGGGTPTLLPPHCFERLMSTLSLCFEIDSTAEITVECNPATIDYNGLLYLRRLGINRLSIGLQSAQDNELVLLGRLHDFKDFCICFEDARRAGFDNISIDLMYGIPAQTEDSFRDTLIKACKISPEHISAYGLKIEEGTVFAKNRDSLALPDEDAEYRMYAMCLEILKENGYERYEISNFAKPNRQSKHNLRYWQLKDYIGFGVAAHSFVDGVRFGNSRDINAFLEGKDITEEKYEISYAEYLREFVMLSLRLEEGIDTEQYKKLFGRDFKSDFCVDKFVKMDFMREWGNRIAFTTKGFFVSNAILCELLYFD